VAEKIGERGGDWGLMGRPNWLDNALSCAIDPGNSFNNWNIECTMKNLIRTFGVITAAFAIALPALAQEHRASPHETVSANVDGAKVSITYGRPYKKDRKIWGGLVPYGKVWRTGADEATTLKTDKPLVFGSTTVPAGTYTLYTLPEEGGGAKLIINKKTGQWGTVYDEKEDLARVDLKKDALSAPADQFTITISPSSTGGGVLKLAWDNAAYSIPFTVGK